jgi:hypothetical protein
MEDDELPAALEETAEPQTVSQAVAATAGEAYVRAGDWQWQSRLRWQRPAVRRDSSLHDAAVAQNPRAPRRWPGRAPQLRRGRQLLRSRPSLSRVASFPAPLLLALPSCGVYNSTRQMCIFLQGWRDAPAGNSSGKRKPGRPALHHGCQVCGGALDHLKLFHQVRSPAHTRLFEPHPLAWCSSRQVAAVSGAPVRHTAFPPARAAPCRRLPVVAPHPTPPTSQTRALCRSGTTSAWIAWLWRRLW